MKKEYLIPNVTVLAVRLLNAVCGTNLPGASGDNGGGVPPGTKPIGAPGRTLYI